MPDSCHNSKLSEYQPYMSEALATGKMQETTTELEVHLVVNQSINLDYYSGLSSKNC